MKQYEIKIFVGTSIKGPFIKDGCFAAIVEYTTSKGAVTREVTGDERQTTYYRLVLLAIVKALEILNAPCSITIYTDCFFIKNTAERGKPEDWRRSEWIKSSGTEVVHKELWQQFVELMDTHKIAFQFSKHSVYEERLQKLLGGKNRCLINLENLTPLRRSTGQQLRS